MMEQEITTRLFTPDEANRALPLVQRIVKDILSTGRALQALEESRSMTDRDHERELRKLGKQLEGQIEELELIGCSYKDWNFEQGLVDFPAELDGERVLLCWKSDEERVQYYHGLFDGFSGRKEIPLRYLNQDQASAQLGEEG